MHRVDAERRCRRRAAAPGTSSARVSQLDADPAGHARRARGRRRSPSLTSIIAVAPSSAAAGPASYGGSGRRCAATTRAGERNPRAEHGQPGRGPAEPAGVARRRRRAARRTGSPAPGPRRSPSAVTASTSTSAADHVAADHARRRPARHSARIPSASSVQPGRPAGPAGHGEADAAARSAPRPSRRCRPGSARRPCGPTSSAVDQSRRKCRPSTSRSVRGHHPAVRRGHAPPRRRRGRAACSAGWRRAAR